MMKLVVFCAAVAVIKGQMSAILVNLHDKLDNTVDTIHGWRLEDHTTTDDHILLFIRDEETHRECYVVEVARRWENDLQDHTKVELIAEEIYHLIMNHNHQETDLTPVDLYTQYHDFDAARECQGHATHKVRYTPSWITGSGR